MVNQPFWFFGHSIRHSANLNLCTYMFVVTLLCKLDGSLLRVIFSTAV